SHLWRRWLFLLRRLLLHFRPAHPNLQAVRLCLAGGAGAAALAATLAFAARSPALDRFMSWE
ncbi:MAG: hypothetical protein ACK5D7_09610, partial [Planctomycetota bacterium]